jgi:hypothetical protein
LHPPCNMGLVDAELDLDSVTGAVQSHAPGRPEAGSWAWLRLILRSCPLLTKATGHAGFNDHRFFYVYFVSLAVRTSPIDPHRCFTGRSPITDAHQAVKNVSFII